MWRPRLTARLAAGYLLLVVAATGAFVALAGQLTTAGVLFGLGLAALAALLAVGFERTLSQPLTALTRAVDRLVRSASLPPTPSAWRPERPDLAELTRELGATAGRLRERLDGLTEERDRAWQILDALDDGVLLFDGAGRLLVANPAARAWFGIPDDFRPGLPAGRVLGAHQVTGFAELAAGGREPTTGTVTLVFPEHRTLAVRAFPLADRGPSGRIVVTLVDITQRRRLEVLRRDFVANASHELKTPVAAVRALAETLQSALPDDPATAGRFAARIGREADRLDALVRDLLDLSRVEQGGLAVEPVDLVGLVKETAGGYAGRADERRIELRTELEPGVVVRGDRAQLGLLLSNLIDNALRFTDPCGLVTVRMAGRGDRVELEVADTGRGIPSSELPRIFERFYRVDKARARHTGGTGLGLAIVRHVAEAHGGSVRVASELGRGSTFTATLPLAGPPARRT